MYLSYLLKIFFACILTNVSQNELTLKIKMGNPLVYKKEDLSIKLELSNLTTNQILIHKHAQIGYISFCYADFCFTVEKKSTKSLWQNGGVGK